MHSQNRRSWVVSTGAPRSCSRCWGRAGHLGLGISSDSARTQHLTLSSYQNWFWRPTLENQSPPYSETCLKPDKDGKTKQSHFPCSCQPDLAGYKCMWEHWPASPTRLEADGEGTAKEFHVSFSPSVSSALSGQGTTLRCQHWGRR